MGTITAVSETRLEGRPLVARGKVRDIYDLGDRLLLVATDRLSAFDVVLPTPIPGRGILLTQLSAFWFERMRDLVPNHLLSLDLADMPEPVREKAEVLDGRVMLVRKAEVYPVECVVRGYLAGSGYKDYARTGEVCGHRLPTGLLENQRLPEPIFTPATKAPRGEHDENVDRGEVARVVGLETARRLEEVSLSLYRKAAAHAEARGLILADTKFEFGLIDGRLTLVDECLTPDSSRYWPLDGHRPGEPVASYDKQIVRDWLASSGWDRRPPGPELPAEVVARTAARYREALDRLTGLEDGSCRG